MDLDEHKPLVRNAHVPGGVTGTGVARADGGVVGEGGDDQFEARVYKRRWWITGVFSLAAVTQAMIWDTWGPIAESSELVLGWTDDTIALIMNLSAVSFIIVVIPISMVVDAKGLRACFLLCSFLLLLAAVIRVPTLEPAIFTPVAHIAAVFQGVGGAISFAGPAVFSALWFPLNERETATAITSFCNYFGVAISFIIAPLLVPNPVYEYETVNVSLSNTSTDIPTRFQNITFLNLSETPSEGDMVQVVTNMAAMRSGIQNVLYLHLGLAGLVFVCAVVYFPDRPPSPPSKTASLTRTNYGEGLRRLVTNRQLWVVVVAGSLPRALLGSWISVFDIVAKPLGVSQTHAGWIGFWHMLIGSVAGIVFAKFSHLLHSRRKALVIVSTVICLAMNLWVGLLCEGLVPFRLTELYVSCIILGVFINGTVPLFYEISAETAYPVGEGVAGGFYTLVFCLFELVFFSGLSVPGLGVTWTTWACAGSLAVSLPLLAVFKERNKRLEIDELYTD